jgi:hypothetical protein
MRYRFTFVAGLAAGYVLGTRAGRERYEQIKRLGQRAAGSPAVQKAAGTVSAKATELGNAAKDKATGKMPKFTEMAMSKASAIPGLRGRVNGSADYPASEPPGPDVYNPPPSPGTSMYPDGS